jgi:NADPH:quinone reductase-like Zn-dependent oxidoreductase
VASGDLAMPVEATYPLEEVRAAYTRLAERHTLGKIVLRLR